LISLPSRVNNSTFWAGKGDTNSNTNITINCKDGTPGTDGQDHINEKNGINGKDCIETKIKELEKQVIQLKDQIN
jgi:hypothetical protein